MIGSSGGYERLLPEESIKGYAAFEIPKDAEPIEAVLKYIPVLIRFSKSAKMIYWDY